MSMVSLAPSTFSLGGGGGGGGMSKYLVIASLPHLVMSGWLAVGIFLCCNAWIAH